jgi:hypothetical protein
MSEFDLDIMAQDRTLCGSEFSNSPDVGFCVNVVHIGISWIFYCVRLRLNWIIVQSAGITRKKYTKIS